MPPPDGINDGKTLKSMFDAQCEAKLRGKAKTRALTLADVWRLGGWKRGDDTVDPGEHPNIKDLDMDEIRSIAEAFECHLGKKGNTNNWKYVGTTYSCCCCCACAVVVHPDMFS